MSLTASEELNTRVCKYDSSNRGLLTKNQQYWVDLQIMPRCSHSLRGLQPEVLLKLELGVLLPLSIAVGGATGFMPTLHAFALVGCLAAAFAAVAATAWAGWKFYQGRVQVARAFRVAQPAPAQSGNLGGVVIVGPFRPLPRFNLVDAALLTFEGETSTRDRYNLARRRFGAPNLPSLNGESAAAA